MWHPSIRRDRDRLQPRWSSGNGDAFPWSPLPTNRATATGGLELLDEFIVSHRVPPEWKPRAHGHSTYSRRQGHVIVHSEAWPGPRRDGRLAQSRLGREGNTPNFFGPGWQGGLNLLTAQCKLDPNQHPRDLVGFEHTCR